MIDPKEAAERAAEYFGHLYSDKPYEDLLLEEVELTEDEKNWLITLSYAYNPPASSLEVFLKPKPRRYKTFKIDASTGDVKAMKIRSLN